jgi:hypothetical protein
MGLQANPRTAGAGQSMAIYSLHHSSIGKSTQTLAHTAAAHVRYITRAKALSRIAGARMPTKAGEASSFLKEAENSDRKNARVIDKLMLALPRELNGRQRYELVRGFAEAITEGKAPWLAAFHEKGKDANNPHCHLVIRDRDAESGKRVFGMSEKGSTERLRLMWEEHANAALAEAQKAARIDRRTLAAQGIKREPTIHEGVQGRRMHRQRRQFKSRRRSQRNHPFAKSKARSVDYPAIDKGQSRCAYNAQVRLRSAETETDYWQAIDADRQRQELDELRSIHLPPAERRVLLRSYLDKHRRVVKPSSRTQDRGRENDDEHEP